MNYLEDDLRIVKWLRALELLVVNAAAQGQQISLFSGLIVISKYVIDSSSYYVSAKSQ